MTYLKLSQSVSVTGQISVEDLSQIKQAGFHLIINNRPDGEMPGQPSAESVSMKAKAIGIDYIHIPVQSPPFPEGAVSQFVAALNSAQGPVLAHCRSGMRSSCLWAFSQLGEQSIDDIITTAADAGFDLSGLVPLLQAQQSVS